MQRDIHQTWFFPHPPELVWDALTNPEQLGQWLMQNDFKPIVGHRFQFVTKPKVKIGFDGIVYCEVLEIIPMKKLSYSWKGGPGNGKMTLDSVVTWHLLPRSNGTEVTLEQKGFKGWKNYISSIIMSKGWSGRIRKRMEKLLMDIKK